MATFPHFLINCALFLVKCDTFSVGGGCWLWVAGGVAAGMVKTLTEAASPDTAGRLAPASSRHVPALAQL